jgi:hypothetical protein
MRCKTTEARARPPKVGVIKTFMCRRSALEIENSKKLSTHFFRCCANNVGLVSVKRRNGSASADNDAVTLCLFSAVRAPATSTCRLWSRAATPTSPLTAARRICMVHTRDPIPANLIARVALVEFGFLLSASSKLQLLSDAEIHLALCCILRAKYVIEGIELSLLVRTNSVCNISCLLAEDHAEQHI